MSSVGKLSILLVYGYKLDNLVTVHPVLQGTPHVFASSLKRVSIGLIGSPKTTVII